MNDFTKEELKNISYGLECCGLSNSELHEKVISLIYDTFENENIITIGTGKLLFPAKEHTSRILRKINNQLNRCDYVDENHLFRIDWRIIYGKTYGDLSE